MKRRWSLLWAARFVSKWEGWSSVPYQDSVGQWTIGFGHTAGVGPQTRSISKAKGLKLLSRDLRVASRAVNLYIHVPLTVRQRIALISFTFNCGGGALQESTLRRKLNSRDYHGAADEFLKWDKAGGVTLFGLLRRRRAERWLFLHSKR